MFRRINKTFYLFIIFNLCDFTSANSSQKILISTIKEVLSGHKTDTFEKAKNGQNFPVKKNPFKSKVLDISEQKCFSITFNDARLPLDLVAKDVETANKWVRTPIPSPISYNLYQ